MFRFFTSDLRRNLTKLLCLTVGLAISFLLLAKIYIEGTYDSFFPEAGQIYRVTESLFKHGEFIEHRSTPGAIAPGMKQYIPQVMAATRFTDVTGPISVETPDGRLFDTDGVILADSCHFDVLSRPIIAGDPHEVLAVEGMCMIPRSLAEKIGGDVIGMQISSPQTGADCSFTIGGIYEDYPLNSSFANTIHLSMPSIKYFMADGTDNWMGNDRYTSHVLLAKGTSPDDVKPYIEQMVKDNLHPKAIEIFRFSFGITPMLGIHESGEGVKTMLWVLGILTFIILLSASLNYLLIVIGQMNRRHREMAVRKCYGTSNARIFGRIMGESVFFMLVSMVLAVLIVLCLSDRCMSLFGFTAADMLTTGRVWLVELGMCVILLVITGVIPAWMYCRTPVAEAFRPSVGGRRRWKLALLAVQFFASGVLVCLLVLVMRQYRLMDNGDMGYEYDDVALLSVPSLPQETRATIVSELRKLGDVRNVASAYHNFVEGASGNNVWMEGDPREDNQVNVADMYSANAELFDVLGMEFVQGEPFRETTDSTSHQVVVEERFIKLLKDYFDVTDDNIVGKRFNITEHISIEGSNEFTICGVIRNIRRGGYDNDRADTRAGVIFPTPYIGRYIYVRFNKLTPEAVSAAQAVIKRVSGDENLFLMPFKAQVESLNASVRNFGTAVTIALLAILLITAIGLTGYTADEVQRRAKEIAIRKVTGTPASGIVRLFCTDILKVALPSLLAGGAVAMIIGGRWLSQFTDRVSLSPLSMAGCIALILVLLVAVVAFCSLSVARSNPVNHLRNE